jgi:hypothetical protein
VISSRSGGPGLLAASALLLALIHPTTWKMNSANFAITAFSEVRPRSSHLAVLRSWCSGIGISRGPPLSEFGARRLSQPILILSRAPKRCLHLYVGGHHTGLVRCSTSLKLCIFRLCSPQCMEGKFCEVRLDGVLGSCSQAIWRCAGVVAMASCLCSREQGLANGRASREGAPREPCTPE